MLRSRENRRRKLPPVVQKRRHHVKETTEQRTHRTAKSSSAIHQSEYQKAFQRRFAKSISENIRHLRMNILATMPGMLDTDDEARDLIIHYFCDQYPEEVKVRLKS
jgi:hypothetical protein